MKSIPHHIVWAGERLALLPERALWWQRKKTLFIADPHFGKASAFRLAGIAVPETSQDDDLIRLEKIVCEHAAKRLVVLGDFFHAKSGRSEVTMAALTSWRERQADLDIVLIGGNHDQHAGPPPPTWNIRCVSEPWTLKPFFCCHKPPGKMSHGFFLAGHIHPAFSLYERNGMNARCVCFYFQKHTAILPAFGHFTGAHAVRPKAGERVFLVVDRQIIDATKTIRNCVSPVLKS